MSKSICTFAKQNDKTMENTHFEYLQLQHDWHQQQDNETGGEDVSKVDKYRPPYDLDYTDFYERQEKQDR
jgi:hypothetical protein